MILFSTATKSSQTALVALLGLVGIAMLANSIADLGGTTGTRRVVGKGRRILESVLNTDYMLVGSGLCEGNELVGISTTNNVNDVNDCFNLCDADPACVGVQHNWVDGICQLYSEGASSSLPRDNDISYSHTNCYNNIYAGRNAMETTCAAACAAEPTCATYNVIEMGDSNNPETLSFYCTLVDASSNEVATLSDPIITGLNGQVFKFDGRTDAWYANVASKSLQWNVGFHKFDECPAEQDVSVLS